MAGIPRTESIVAESIASSSSPSRSALPRRDASTVVDPLVPVKRAARTYGRSKADITTTDVVRDDPGSRARILKTAPRDADAQVIPESDDVDERAPKFDGFDWRAKLKAIDDDYDGSGEINAKSRTTSASLVSCNDASNFEESLLPVASPLSSLPHPSLRPEAVGAGDLFSGSQCNLLTSDRSSASSLSSGSRGLLSNKGSKKSGKVEKLSHIVFTTAESSDSENTSPEHSYGSGSPKMSSPTPPTSPFAGGLNEPIENEEPPNDVSKPSRHLGKFKERGKINGKRKKAPTKKEVVEAKKESARLLADQHVSIRHTPAQSVHTIANLFNKLKSAPAVVATQDSDPITSFSSPGHLLLTPGCIASSRDATSSDADKNAVAGLPERPMPHLPQMGVSVMAEKPGHYSEEDMPDPDSLLRNHDKKTRRLASEHMETAEAERRAGELQDRKLKALELNKAQSLLKVVSSKVGVGTREDSDSDDGLEIVEDMVSFPVPSSSNLDKDAKQPVRRPRASIDDKRAGKESVSKSETVSQRSLELAARPRFISAQYKNGSKRKGGQGASVSHKDLNNLMLQRADKQSGAIDEKKKERWVKAGGSLKELNPANPPVKSVTDWLHEGSTREDSMEVDEANNMDDSEDPEYTPEGAENLGTNKFDTESGEPDVSDGESAAAQHIDVSDDGLNADTDKENHRPALRRQSARAIVDSEDEDDPGAGPSGFRPVVLAPDTSLAGDSMDSPGEDKENSAELAFDLSEDKENARVPRHVPRGRVLIGNTSPSPDHRDGDGHRGSREPLSSLDVAGEGPFMPPLAQRRDSTQGRVLQVLHEEDRSSTLSPLTSRKTRVLRRRMSSASSPGSIDEGVQRPMPFLGGGFSQLFSGNDNVVDEGPVPAIAVGEGSFSQFFSPGGITRESPLNKKEKNPFRHHLGPTARDEDFHFTQPNSLLPSVRISESQRREVDEMFGKDQEFKLEEAKRSREETNSGETRSLSEPGFPDFRQFAPSQPSQLSPQFIRRPLETLSLDPSDAGMNLDESPEGVPRRRLLRERPQKIQASSSPLPALRNAFDVLRDAAAKDRRKEPAQKPFLEKSDFIEAEAEESDEEAMFGFGRAKEDEDGEGGDDPNAVVEGLVDDAPMDATAQAADLVLEKHMEHQAADDAAIEKLHQDAVAGKLRAKRRDRGVGFEDSDSDDEEHRGPRGPLSKKRRVEGDTLESYGLNPETKAFYDAYQAELVEDADPRLTHLQQDSRSIQDQHSDSGEDEPETIDSAEVRRRLKELSRRGTSLEPEHDFRNLAWVENEDEEMVDNVKVEERPFRVKKPAAGTRAALDHLDFQAAFKSKKIHSAEQVQLRSWATEEARTHSASGRGGFSRKEEGSKSGMRRSRGPIMTSEAPATGSDTQIPAKSSSLVSRIEKSKGFDT